MDSDRVDEILKTQYALGRSLEPIFRPDRNGFQDWEIIGLDTEYTNDGKTTISYQLYGDEQHQLFIIGPKRLAIGDLVMEVRKLYRPRKVKRVLFPAFFNVAEFSQLETPFWYEQVKVFQVHPAGIYHVRGVFEPLKPEMHEIRTFETEFYFYDLWHFFASMKDNKLHAVAEYFGLKKMEYDVTNLTLMHRYDPEFRLYAMNDARIAKEIFVRLFETYKKVNGVSIISCPTPASASMRSFKRVYLKHSVKAPSPVIRELALRADWGGRVECGFVGEMDKVHEYDADSLYPRSAVLFKTLPDGSDWKSGFPNDLTEVEGFADVEFVFPGDEEWPCLPVFTKGCIYFPLAGRSVCTLSEIKTAIDQGCEILKVHESVYYKRGSCRSFQEYIMDQLKMKEANERNAAIRAIAKLNMNSVIGKLIQNKGGMDFDMLADYLEENWESLDDETIALLYAGVIEPKRFQKDTILGSGFYPEWHSLILGRSRQVVADAIYNADDYPEILMVSTDSIHLPHARLGRTLVRFNHQFGPVYFKAIRCRVHVTKDSKTGKVLKLAKHAMPIPFERAANLILTSKHRETIEVHYKGMKTMREAILTHDQIGASKDCKINIDFRPDRKRRVDDAGWTHPLVA